jgi:hypothetical protein
VKRLAAAVVLLLCASCVGSGTEISGDLRNVGGVTETFKVSPARAKVGQAITFSLRLVNNAGLEERLIYPTGQRYDFWATIGSHEHWRWSDGRVFTQAVTKESIPAQTGTTFTASWTPERPGTYVVHGLLKAERYERELTGKLEVE